MTSQAGTTSSPNTHHLSSRTIAGGILAIVLLLFALFNTQRVRVHWIFATTTAPLIVIIAGCALIGIAIGWVIARRRAARRA